MNDLIVHDITRRQLEAFTAVPAHAVMLVGPAGGGKLALAVMLAETVLGLGSGDFADYPYKTFVIPEEGKSSISIEAVRQLEHFLSLKVPRAGAHNRVVIIENAQTLTTEAQNALLKTLEEPPRGTLIMLGVTHERALLPTIRSRAQAISIKRPDRAALEAYFAAKNHGQSAIRQAYAISAGLPGLMSALLDQTDHPLLQATEQARQLLSTSAYDRLLAVDELSKQRVLAIETAGILQQMAHISLQTAAGPAAVKWQAIMAAAYKTAEDLSASAQPKLALTELMLSL
jgi:DNA polymerase III delta prime subunit